VFKPRENILSYKLSRKDLEDRINDLTQNTHWTHIAKINHQMNITIHRFFNRLGALFTLLPLTTRMISSPGAFYGKNKVKYTTDTMPITLKWFKLRRPVFLSESSQIYLEMALLQKEINHVYSMYNSFRKEEADATHLSEFHHIEYEGKVSQNRNLEIISELVFHLIKDLLNNNENDLLYFLERDDLWELEELCKQKKISTITFQEALNTLYDDTHEKKYAHFTVRHFGRWEEIRLTEIYCSIVALAEFPLLEVPFYHAQVKNKEPAVAENADILWPGYSEIIGSGHRVRNYDEIMTKARLFALPAKDYIPYLLSRKASTYAETSGFGCGWERFLQGILKMPHIWSASQFPRAHIGIQP
jgi:asparaginyl-tRNA synthetase